MFILKQHIDFRSKTSTRKIIEYSNSKLQVLTLEQPLSVVTFENKHYFKIPNKPFAKSDSSEGAEVMSWSRNPEVIASRLEFNYESSTQFSAHLNSIGR